MARATILDLADAYLADYRAMKGIGGRVLWGSSGPDFGVERSELRRNLYHRAGAWRSTLCFNQVDKLAFWAPTVEPTINPYRASRIAAWLTMREWPKVEPEILKGWERTDPRATSLASYRKMKMAVLKRDQIGAILREKSRVAA
jgi:hypothetical protein